jgi:hypothetical protein
MGSLIVVFTLLFAAPLASQNNGLPTQRQSAVLMELIADRGLHCGLLRPWQAASLRMQTREMTARFGEAGRAAIAAEIEARRPDMGCDDRLLTTWITGAGPNLEREYLPELLAGYRALALQDPPPAPFVETAGREDFARALVRIDAKLAALEAAGEQPAGQMSWRVLAERQERLAAQIGAAIAGTGDAGRFSSEQAANIAADVARIGELWLADQPEREP